MPVKKEPSGHRSVEAEVEVPGTPEAVWQAIATGPGISSWFVPSEVEERAGGAAISHFGPGDSMDSVGTVTEWDPPRRFVVETLEDPGTVASEWSVEARSGGTCVVRVVHRWFASGDEWDDQFEGHTHGWVAFFRILKLYLAHFAGETGSGFQLMGTAPEPASAAWEALAGALGLAGATEGQRVVAATGAPPLAGTVAHTGPAGHTEMLLRIDRPASGIVHLFALPMGGKVYLPVRFYLYGAGAADAVARHEESWRAWMNGRFGGA